MFSGAGDSSGGSRRRGRRPAPEPPADREPDADADPVAVARAIVLRQLTMAPRSRAQLAEKLAARDVPDDVATAVLDRFEEVGLVDDAAYAETLVRSRQQTRGLARKALAQDLRRKGVDDDTAREALATVTPEDEETAARALVARKLRTTRGVEPTKRAQRLAGMLARKGYGAGVAYRVVREVLAEEDAEFPVGSAAEDLAGD